MRTPSDLAEWSRSHTWAATLIAIIALVGVLGVGLWVATVVDEFVQGEVVATNDEFLDWTTQNGSLGREIDGFAVSLVAVEDRPELDGVEMELYAIRVGNGYGYQVRIEGTGDICGLLEGMFEIDGEEGEFLNDVFPEPDEMSIGASRPHFPYICKPDPKPGTIDVVLVAPFEMTLEPGALTLANAGGTVRFVVADE